MTIRWLLAALHLIALGLGFAAIIARRRALLGTLDPSGLRKVFTADSWWGIAAILWIATGLTRAFGGFEKGTDYYLHNTLFIAKMAILIVILALEIQPMITLIRWRIALGRKQSVNTTSAPWLATVCQVQAVLVILMVIAATGMARGVGSASHP